ncbi:MAG: hypothetical protein A2V70_16490 [Planctomycetes bacterium RBG_13_63_9]|nr:MAG: hypothetical protein A2V70_16490 [Planctomycetes bacterium RBG_13_63_9]
MAQTRTLRHQGGTWSSWPIRRRGISTSQSNSRLRAATKTHLPMEEPSWSGITAAGPTRADKLPMAPSSELPMPLGIKLPMLARNLIIGAAP